MGRNLWRALASGCAAAGLLGLSAPAVLADDDYPWAWQGRCPIVPQVPIVEPTPAPAPTPAPTPNPTPGVPKKAGETPEALAVAPLLPPPPPPPVLDTLTGHLYDPRGPRPTCARRVWSINGSIGDPWGFVLRNCTSFVAWRLDERNRMAGFANDIRGVHFGNAENWDDAARELGYRVDSVPAIGAVAQSDSGRVGHVAWVTDIGPGTVTIEEYNHTTPGGYGVRTVPVTDFRYLHLDDVAPSPLLGSDRPVVSVPNGLGESWTARITESGTLRVAAPGRRARVAGPRGDFSPLAAPALSIDHRGRPWVAATARDGRVLAGVDRGTGFALRIIGTAAATSSPALSQSRTRRPVVATISPDGTLSTRRLTHLGRWSRPHRVGRPASWATHTAPVMGNDESGRTWLVAVGVGGTTWSQSLHARRPTRLAGSPGSITSTPVLTTTEDGTTYLHQITAQGRLVVRTLARRRWSRPAPINGDWSPYASPAVGVVADRLHVAAVDRHGGVVLRAAVPGERSQLAGRVPSSGDPTRSPGLVTRRNAGVFVVADSPGRTRRAQLLARPAAAVVGASAPKRGGFTP